jgi:hypothetical protein
MKTAAQGSILVSFGSWFRKAKTVVRREALHALNLHLQNCAVVAEAYRRK